MKETDIESEYLFVIGAGASAASASQKKRKLFGIPTWEKFIDLLRIIDKMGEIELNRIIDDCHLDRPYNEKVQRVLALSEKKGTNDVSALIKILSEEKYRIAQRMNKAPSSQGIPKEYWPIILDIQNVVDVIICTIAAYYRNIDPDCYSSLWQIARKSRSPIISLNWDINLEKIIFEDSKVPMSNYYGDYIFRNLSPQEQDKGFNPVVEILKPHGSLNWHFRTNELNRTRQIERTGSIEPISAYGGNFEEDEYCLHVYDCIPNNPFALEELNQYAFWIPPLPEKEIILLDDRDARDYFDNYWKRKIKIENAVLKQIDKYAKTSRTLVIIGYSFPPGDEHIRKLFTSNRFENIWVFDTNEKVFQRIKDFFPNATSFEFKKGGFADIMNWPDVGEGFKPSRMQ
jgi:hypothetical protein